ncbi:MAG: thioredoxin family protein [Aureispira sp.]|nr:thioredoxin family protein [Aureispira sp.]
MDTVTTLLKENIALGMSYEKYLETGNALLAEDKTSGSNHSEQMVKYSQLNIHRMNRLNKTIKILPDLEAIIKGIDKPIYFLIISEIWCGDAAQNVPILAKIAELNEHIQVRIVWRDENLDLMDQYLTNGGRSIPKLIIVDGTTHEELATWGPRPATAQEMVIARKKEENPEPYSEFVKKVQLWYAKDRTKSAQVELQAILAAL